MAAVLSGGTAVGVRPATAATNPDWLDRINVYRTASGLATVTEQPAWSTGISNHLTYLARTPASYRTGSYQSAHTENPNSPYYTQDGAKEAGASDLFEGGVSTPIEAVDGWLTAPFHAVGMLRPNLTQVAFAHDAGQGSAGLDVISGLSGSGTSTAPVLYPGNGMTTNLTSFTGESPSPVESCPAPVGRSYGLPLVALLPSTPDPALTADLQAPDGSKSSSGAGLCVVDQHTFRSSDPVYGPTGAQILQGDRAVFLVPSAPLTAGRYWASIHQPNQPDIRWSFVVAPQGSPSVGGVYDIALSRVAGDSRDATSVAASRLRYPAGGSASAVVLASDQTFPDALAGTPLAVARNGPLLLTAPGGLRAVTADEIRRVLPAGATVYVLGGTGAVSSSVDDALVQMGYAVRRLAGANRYETAVAIAGELGNPSTVLEVTGVDFADGVSAGPAAAAVGGAVLLTAGSQAQPATAAYLSSHPVSRSYAVGGPACAADPSAVCVSGASRYDTSVAVAEQFFRTPSAAGFASGAAFPDALSGGAALGGRGQPLVIVPPTGELPPRLVSYLAGQASTLTSGVVFGGVGAVDVVVYSELR